MMVTDTRTVRLMLVEDHGVLTDGLCALADCCPDVEVVGVARTVAEAPRLASERRPDVVLMDFQLPDGTGPAAAQAIRHQSAGPPPAIVFLSASDREEDVERAVESGAVGYLLKVEEADRIIDAVRRAARGEILIPPSVLAKVIADGRARRQAESQRDTYREALTHREVEVLRLMAAGYDNHSLARMLGIRYTTIRAHVRNILAKVGAHSKLEAVARARELQLLSD